MHKTVYIPDDQFLVFVPETNETADGLWERHRVFVCGALQNPNKTEALLGHPTAFAPAVVKGFRRAKVSIDGTDVPFMLPCTAPDAALSGVVWLNLSDEDLAAIESLELKDNLRERFTVEVRLGERTVLAFTYVKKSLNSL